MLAPPDVFADAHAALTVGDDWLIDGLGRRGGIGPRLARATEIVLVDLPPWVHFWLAAERQIAWATGTLRHPPGGQAAMSPTEVSFRAISEVDRDWMPEIRGLVSDAEARGAAVTRIGDLAGLDAAAVT